ncbi:MAG: DUF6677 family protein [Phycisphaerales bacterium]
MPTALPTPTVHDRFDPMCLVLGWLLPGLGHWRIGQKRRGSLIATGILLMFGIGILVGGVDVVDRREDWLWFLPQALLGPITLVADAMNQAYVKTGRLGQPSLAAVNDYGTLFVGLGGLMNLAAMIDAATRKLDSKMIRSERRERVSPRVTPAINSSGEEQP